ncbi:MAG TPA: MliC family protein [Candidatus Aquabacterium excrementipullorum]|nr:MliC family protein [Candidatus Aquabacterium excrementipullorum]
MSLALMCAPLLAQTGGVASPSAPYPSRTPGPTVAPSTPVTAPSAASSVSRTGTCAQARPGNIPEMICQDEGLRALDKSMDGFYAQALKKVGNEQPPVLAVEQSRWRQARDGCWKATDRLDCVQASYRHRIIELQARYRLVDSIGPVTYVCDDNPPNKVVVDYFKTEPPSLLARQGERTALMLAAPSASGARYTGTNESLWEHQGEAAIRWGFGAPERKCIKQPETAASQASQASM